MESIHTQFENNYDFCEDIVCGLLNVIRRCKCKYSGIEYAAYYMPSSVDGITSNIINEELNILSKLYHINLGAVHDVFPSDEGIIFVIEFLKTKKRKENDTPNSITISVDLFKHMIHKNDHLQRLFNLINEENATLKQVIANIRNENETTSLSQLDLNKSLRNYESSNHEDDDDYCKSINKRKNPNDKNILVNDTTFDMNDENIRERNHTSNVAVENRTIIRESPAIEMRNDINTNTILNGAYNLIDNNNNKHNKDIVLDRDNNIRENGQENIYNEMKKNKNFVVLLLTLVDLKYHEDLEPALIIWPQIFNGSTVDDLRNIIKEFKKKRKKPTYKTILQNAFIVQKMIGKRDYKEMLNEIWMFPQYYT